MPANTEDALRAQLAKLLDWEDAHVGFDKAVTGIPPRLRGAVPRGLPHSAWQLVEHLRIANADILEFCRTAKYKEKKWPDDYWPPSPSGFGAPRRSGRGGGPASPKPPSDAAWTRTIAGYRRDRKALQRLAKNAKIDLFATIPHGTGQTYLREFLLIADHTAYHVGQLIAVRQALGIWK